jgi:hypothetical protein
MQVVHAQNVAEGDIVLSGVLTHAEHRSYREHRFTTPPGVRAVYIDIEYERGEPWTAIDMALYDPQRFRGASGFAKLSVFLGEDVATPSYLPGPLPAGEWTLVLGGANAPEGRQTPYRVRVRLDSSENAGMGAFATVINDAPGWYRGDFHTHTGHSDGSCQSFAGERVPCPVYRTLDAARARGLDFVAVSDHNTTSHLPELMALQPTFDALAIIPAQEVTTYHGHMNVFGVTAPVEFRLASEHAPRVEDISQRVARLGGVLSINHPGISLTEGCPGCGWSAAISDYENIAAVEVVNGVIARWGGGADGGASSIPFWMSRLNEGHRLTAIGGSDNHDPVEPGGQFSAIGRPTTVVYAGNLSAPAILAGMRAGRVFIDLDGVEGRVLALSARSGAARAQMGDVLRLRRGAQVRFEIEVAEAPDGARLEIWRDGEMMIREATRQSVAGDARRAFSWRSDGHAHWFCAMLRDREGRLLLLANPIYIHPAR